MSREPEEISDAALRIARLHRAMLWTTVPTLLTFAAYFILAAVSPQQATAPATAAATWVTMLGPCASLIGFVIYLVVLSKLLEALGSGAASIALACVGAFLPLINLLVFLSAHSRAIKRLKQEGLSIGLLGAKIPRREFDPFEEIDGQR
ncbi:MAG: hypothetical protein AAGD00_01815 [Planctomycetota bacterium]